MADCVDVTIYTPTEWKDHTVARPKTYEMIENEDGTITLVPSEGEVIQQGTPLNAGNLNKLENAMKLAAEEREKLGVAVDEKWECDLLWENAAPTSEIGGSHADVDMTEYDGGIVEIYTGTSLVTSHCISSPFIRKNSGYTFISFSGGTAYRRTVYVSDAGLQWATGVTGNTTGDKANNIPYRFWGVKGVPVHE